ncbi:SDR family oxidoreductase [Niabella drilacis]|uniref:UDP-N-acetylglucosamine 4-epimerase n=1 Tax=Niabella drilacis (strain DSM 25811 / CCM 8410 / CCUG 62505 / LMG 26954 / E90) TaxID=1285928 RepID=A0A1G6NPZ2_NIADE|nr:SDR family oxidoreductase [Niabella drilacis]SDC69778.1 UDP-N-acetylglucosamine 4-epimerase [Niabella drilacis]
MMRILVTGGAGFIGSNLVAALLKDSRVDRVRVLDNLSTGTKDNLADFFPDERFEWVEGDIRDYETCLRACEGVRAVSHQAALGSVPRSVADPLTTNAVNITGTLNVFTAAKETGIKRMVYAASSSTYGDHPVLPKKEENIGKPLSPYAVTKYVNELYAGVYATLYGLEPIGLRYFNIFGPRQNPKGPYAAVIPLFVKALLNNEAPVINGDGQHSRDFTFVDNAVAANIQALFTDNKEAVNQVYNIACGTQTSLLELFNLLKAEAGTMLVPDFGPARVGDVQHSLADISKAKALLGYQPGVSVKEGLRQTFDWYRSNSGFLG